MPVAGISSSNFLNYESASVQNQQHQFQKEFQKLGQESQAGGLASAPATTPTAAQTKFAASQLAAADSSTVTTPIFASPQGNPVHGIQKRSPHHWRVDAGKDNDSDSDGGTESSNPLEQTLQSGSSSSAQQAYGAWQQDLQQVALNSDLLTAQSAEWQPVSFSA